MGGRGGSSKAGASGGSIPRINNPANIPANAITEEEFLALRGVAAVSSGWTIDKLRGNRQLKTQNGQKRFAKEYQNAENVYQEKRNMAKREYQRLVSQGKIRDKTSIEKTLTRAHGNPDLQSTQAARRVAEKRGIDWRTGKKLKK